MRPGVVLDMRPAFSMDDAPYGMMAYRWEKTGYVALPDTRRRHCPNFFNLLFVQFSQMTLRSAHGIANVSAATLGNAILDIIRLCAFLQVQGVHAKRCITGVHNNHIAKTAVVDFIGNAVGEQGSMIVRYNPVPIAIAGSGPKPTAIGPIISQFVLEVAINRAERLDPSLLLKRCAAVFANFWVRLCHAVDNAGAGHRRQYGVVNA